MSFFNAGDDDEQQSGLTKLLTYGADTDEDRGQQSNSHPVIASEAAAPQVPLSAVKAPTYTPPDRSVQAANQAQLVKDSQPINPRDPSVAPKWWERLAGGAAAGAMAFGRNPNAVEAGSAITNRRYNAAESVRQGKVGADSAAIQAWNDTAAGQRQDFEGQKQAFGMQQTADRNSQMNSDREAQEEQRRGAIAPGSEQPVDPNNKMGAWTATTLGGKTITLNSPPDSYLKTPEGRAAATLAEREEIAKRSGVKNNSEDYKYLMANGKLKEPAAQTNIRIPSADAQEWETYKSALGHKPTTDDVLQFKRGEKGAAKPPMGSPEQFEKVVADRTKTFNAIDENYNNLRMGEKDPKALARIEQERDAEKRKANEGFSQRFSALDPTGARAGAPPQQAAAPPPTPPQRAPQAAPARQGSVSVSDGPAIIPPPKPGAVLNDRAAAMKYLQAAGGDKAKARQMAAKDGWKF